MPIKAAPADIAFKDRFEAGQVSPSTFHHRDHLRLAFVYLCECDVPTATQRMRTSLLQFLSNNGVPASKYHETVTLAWVQAVRHFMAWAGEPASFDAFLAADDRLLNTDIMLTHYQKQTLFSDAARQGFVPPDLQPIPHHP